MAKRDDVTNTKTVSCGQNVDKSKETLAGMNSHFNPGQRRGGLILRDNLEIMNIHNLKK